MTTAEQDQSFIEDIIDLRLLERSLEWIGQNMPPEEVFDKKRLKEWATENGYVKEE